MARPKMTSSRFLPIFAHFAFLLVATLFPVGVANAQSESEPFPFVMGDLVSESAAAFADLNARPAGANGFCRVVDGHFVNDSGRLRIWGVNLCFGANFPSHDEATKLARRLATFGINGIRLSLIHI